MTQELNVRIVRAPSFHGDRSWNYRGTMHPYNTLYFVTGGDGHIRLNGVVTDMLSGYVYLIPPHVRHDIWCDTQVDKVYVDVHVELMPGYDVFSDTNEILVQHIGLERCERMHALSVGGIRERLMLRGEVNLVLAGFMQKDPEPVSAGMAAFRPMITYMQRNLSARLRISELAARFGWSPSVLSRSFKRVFGCGVKQYVEKLLTARLTEELLLTDKTLQQIADEYGFCDGYYLSAYFKRCMGVSPLIYRERQKSEKLPRAAAGDYSR